MSLALPIIAYDVQYNRETTENSAEYFKNSQQLRCLVQEYIEGKLKIDGDKMLEIAQRRYTWQNIVYKYKALIE